MFNDVPSALRDLNPGLPASDSALGRPHTQLSQGLSDHARRASAFHGATQGHGEVG